MAQKIKNRWLIAASAVGIHLSIGSVYAYSVITNPVGEIFGMDASAMKWAFSIAILLLGFSAAFMGTWVEKVGPRKSGRVAGLLYGGGILGAGLSVQLGSFPLFLCSYGFIAGIGLGIGYITPVSTLVKWFPDRRGLATGMAIMGFGFSALIFGPLMQMLFDQIGVAFTFYVLGALYLAIILLSAQFMEKPPEDYLPAGYNPDESKSFKKDLSYLDAKSALKTARFYYIWIMMFINITCGIALIAAASPITQEQLGYTALQAATVVGLIGVFNGLGRILWSSFSDYLGRAYTFILFFAFQALAFYFLPTITAEIFFLIVLFTIITMYGGGFATLPAFLGDLFGTKQLGAIHGLILTSWALAGVAGPAIYSYVKDQTGSLTATLQVFAGMFVLALFVSILMKTAMNKLSKKMARHP